MTRSLPLLILAAVALAPATPARAGIPEDSCFTLSPEAAAAGPVARMTLRFTRLTQRDRDNHSPYRYGDLAVVMAPRGQGLAHGVHGKTLTQNLFCSTESMLCQAAEGDARARIARPLPELLVLTTDDMPVADYGESDLASNLAHPPGRQAEYRLTRADPSACQPG